MTSTPPPADDPNRLSYARYCAEIPAQTDGVRHLLAGADMAAPVPSCPGWSLGQLVRHIGGAHRWVETLVRNRAAGLVPDRQVNDVPEREHESADSLRAWLGEGAVRLAETLREAGPEAQLWTPVPERYRTPVFWARRMTHETAMHRADVALAVGAEYVLMEEVALDAVGEWMEFAALPEVSSESRAGEPPLLGPGRTLHLHATDTAAPGAGEWLVDLTGEHPVWQLGHAKATVAARAPLTDLLLHLYGRPARDGHAVEVLGDAPLLDLWKRRSGYWLHA
ncbi:maleylpyruvate isomerase family mycothiol-dependent enzyme [Streptomyces iconiensis]|uniref:Maleylpyruvate isomerase family mycothiol-dependent enzyme n=1 Tax=Streptomyces iconiensis TaxID=1384038 RepID=A0ABT7A4D7_9ACTN|nr:maleylpyruvate isomerase family mycothiol-dependent enzyme [Streptomyces iconiensis]MDJ1135894.1 maleylpyruvate isomerase family mycothiol-dependent enzyme [Streptomyces iconiensis]